MPHVVLQYPDTVYPGEVIAECPEADAAILALIAVLEESGPSPAVYKVKTLGKAKGYLWQINLKVEKKQIRILYAPYKQTIVLFRIHKKTSPQEQQSAYRLAMKRKGEYDSHRKIEDAKNSGGYHGGNRTLN